MRSCSQLSFLLESIYLHSSWCLYYATVVKRPTVLHYFVLICHVFSDHWTYFETLYMDRGGFRGVWCIQSSPNSTRNLGYLGHFSLYFPSTSPFFLPVHVCKLLGEWHTVQILRRLIRVCTVCSDLSVRIRRVSMVIWFNRTPLRNPPGSAPSGSLKGPEDYSLTLLEITKG